MRDFQYPGRSPVHATGAMAATSHPLATAAALEVLRAGGNALDAAVCACAVQCVVEPHMTAVGGDCFVLHAPADGEPFAFNGSGRAPLAADPAWYREQGIRSIDPDSAHAVTVPGAVDAWCRLNADHGRLGLDRLLAPAIDYAERGFPVHARVASDWAVDAARLSRDLNAARVLLPGGRAPRPGELHRQPELAATLRAVADHGRAGFYEGPVAEDMVAHLNAFGGLHSLEDFAATAGEYVEPIRGFYRGVEILQVPPNSPGVLALLMLEVLAGFDVAANDPRGAARAHLELEAARVCFHERSATVGALQGGSLDLDELLAPATVDRLRALIDPARARSELPVPPLGGGNTVYLCVVDDDRNMVSFVNSIYSHFGSGLLSPHSGVLFQDRGRGFALEETHPNCIGPGKRPVHTLCAGFARDAGRLAMPFGVMGGDYQPIGHAHVLCDMLDFGLDPQAALDTPRAFFADGVVRVERGAGAAVADALAAMGHRVAEAEDPWGGGQIIYCDRHTDVLTGGSDPRKDGCVLGY